MPRIIKKIVNNSKKIQLKLDMCREQLDKCANLKQEIIQEIKQLQEVKELPSYYNTVLMGIAETKIDNIEDYTADNTDLPQAAELLTKIIQLYEKLSDDHSTVQEIKEKVRKLVPKKELRVVFNEEDLELPSIKPITTKVKYCRKDGTLVERQYDQNRPIKPKYKRKLTMTEMSELEAKLLLKCLDKLRDVLAEHAEKTKLE